MGGFGSAVLEAASDAALHTGHIRRLGIPDRFVEHGQRVELLADLGLDADGLAEACRQTSARTSPLSGSAAVRHNAGTCRIAARLGT